MKNSSLVTLTAANVRAVMGYQGHSVSDLAQLLNVHPRTAKAKYDGRSEYDLGELEAISGWLGRPASDLTSDSLLIRYVSERAA